MADKRCASSGGKPSIRVVVSSLEDTTKSSAVPSQTNVTFRPQQSGRLGQSVEHMPSENTSDVLLGLPDLLEIPDDNDKCDEKENEADILENNFFGPIEHTIPVETRAPVSMCATIAINCLTFNMYI